MHTTLNRIREHGPCTPSWPVLLKYLGKTATDDEPLSIITILDSNGLDDAIWALRAVEGHDREIRLYAVWCARQVQHLMTDQRSLDALDVAEKYAAGQATAGEMIAAEAAAWEATWDASGAAERAAARAAAWAVSLTAADASLTAADAARAAARAAADAARAAARAAPHDATWDATWAGAWDAARAAQKTELLRICAALEAPDDE